MSPFPTAALAWLWHLAPWLLFVPSTNRRRPGPRIVEFPLPPNYLIVQPAPTPVATPRWPRDSPTWPHWGSWELWMMGNLVRLDNAPVLSDSCSLLVCFTPAFRYLGWFTTHDTLTPLESRLRITYGTAAKFQSTSLAPRPGPRRSKLMPRDPASPLPNGKAVVKHCRSPKPWTIVTRSGKAFCFVQNQILSFRVSSPFREKNKHCAIRHLRSPPSCVLIYQVDVMG
ncbi:hypothetical protein BDP55DRAFT_385052 [Colletotrichum godetiae]|uniref:Secreted protein n=1 Tax=Colletotrichum godetiae TaxID=1209918 RepID=A0AAJ0EZT2_9PEZI|nr:uncharacterized protein BDP55DRAFT_385052 [Colletotrichum godetiae]KAK1689966.1 hypothetical protein BDP55DRAFT_385052 [Colletotrichum godetiae]